MGETLAITDITGVTFILRLATKCRPQWNFSRKDVGTFQTSREISSRAAIMRRL